MFIKRIRLHGFGRLTGACNFQPGKCNVLCQDNEFGKSTLMDAVLYAFYNFPTTGYKRTDLKPKERYRPWFADGNGATEGRPGYRVELELVDAEGRELLLEADFERQQPFELRDLHTHQAIPLEGTSFGKRYFRMPIQSFTECFFYRQDEREGPGRDDLIRVIEEAAASNQRQQPSSVRQAISALADARLHVPEFSADSIQVETLLKRLDEKAVAVRGKLQDTQADCDRRSQEISAAEQMDVQVRQLEGQRGLLALALLRAEITEIEAALQRQSEQGGAREQREKVLADLEPYATFDPAMRTQVETLASDLRAQQQKLEGLRARVNGIILPELSTVEHALAELPAELATMEAADLEQIRSLRSVVGERRRHAEDESRRVEDLKDQLRSSGVPLEEVEEVLPQLEDFSEADRRCLLDPEGKRASLESAVSDAERRLAESRTLVAQAKARRGQLSTFAGAAAAGAASLGAVAVVLLLTQYTLAGSALLAITLISGAIAVWQLSKRREQVIRSELEPATEQEISINRGAQQLREQVESDRAELSDCMARKGITEEGVQRLKSVAQWMQAAIPYRAAALAQQRTQADLDVALQEAGELLGRVPTYSPADIESQLDRLASDLLQHLDLRSTQSRLVQERSGLEAEIVEGDQDAKAKREALLSQVVTPLESVGYSVTDTPLDELVGAFSTGCEKAIQLQATLAQPAPEATLAPEEESAFRARLQQLTTEWDQKAEQPADNLPSGDRPHLQAELSRIERDREELRVRRINAFNECDRAVETWRREGPQLQEELDRLGNLRMEIVRYGEAVTIAHKQLSDIADEVFRQWATGINERVNQVLPLLNGRYRDVKCSNQLEISAFSSEAGRRLDSRELQHLSKGARDQLQLALRIAVGEYLSAHVGHLPLVFDEPFAHWDDRRFVDGMRFLADLSQRHQIILLSCHHWRYDQLQAMEPDLASRLHFCNLCDEGLLG